MSEVLDLTCELISRPSLTPLDCGCQALIAEPLQALGCSVEWIYAGDVTNILISHGHGHPRAMLLGHTDVVPTGPLEDWTSPPFEPTVRDGCLYGRGAADMKGSVAAMAIAMRRYIEAFPNHPGTISLLLTSDEEGPSTHGVRVVAKMLNEREETPDYCLVGEPSSINELGDTMRIGRRGTINAALTAHGVQGHTAYSDRVVNPVHLLSPLLSELTTIRWDEGTEHFPPTSVQISNINAGTGATNVTPGHATVLFNFRNSPASPAQALKDRVIDLVGKYGVAHYDLDWNVSGEPFFTEPGKLSTAVSDAMETVINRRPVLDTGGGTSDGRFIAPLDAEVVEAGPVNMSIHQIDEHVRIDDLDHIMDIYYESLRRLLDS